MSFESIPEVIEQHFVSEWQNRLPVDFLNLPPNHKGSDRYWCKFYTSLGSGVQRGVGETATHWWVGVATVQLFARENSGVSGARYYSEIIRDIMQRKTLKFDTTGRIQLKTPEPREIDNTPFQINIVTPFEAYQYFTKD